MVVQEMLLIVVVLTLACDFHAHVEPSRRNLVY